MVAERVAVAGQLNTSTYGCRLVVNMPREGLQPWYAVGDAGKEITIPSPS